MSRAGRQGNTHLQAVIAANVRRRRRVLGLSQESLADLCGYHRTYIGAIERGERNITVSTLAALATALEIDIVDLFKRGDD